MSAAHCNPPTNGIGPRHKISASVSLVEPPASGDDGLVATSLSVYSVPGDRRIAGFVFVAHGAL
jgi:hypothetical protein